VLATMQQGEGTHFDPLLLALFFSHLDEMDDIREPRAMGDSAHAVQGPRGRPRFAARV